MMMMFNVPCVGCEKTKCRQGGHMIVYGQRLLQKKVWSMHSNVQVADNVIRESVPDVWHCVCEIVLSKTGSYFYSRNVKQWRTSIDESLCSWSRS